MSTKTEKCTNCNGDGEVEKEIGGPGACPACGGNGFIDTGVFSNGLSDAELERLALLGEEMGEVQQIIGKIIRHGYESYNPFDKEQVTNRQSLVKELTDVAVAVALMAENKDVDLDKMDELAYKKSERLSKFLHYNTIPDHFIKEGI